MKLLIAILIAVLCGAGIGTGTAIIKFREHPWRGGLGTPPDARGGIASIDADEFDFGRMETTENGSHKFTVTNRGKSKLILNLGSTSCSCTVSEIKEGELEPGQSTAVIVTWKSKQHAGPFRQTATILTSDPDPARREIIFKIHGEYFRAVYSDPDELAFGQITGSELATREVRIFSSLPDQPIRITGHHLSEPDREQFFDVESTPLKASDLPKNIGIKSGVLVRVTAKPGLPLGRFPQRIDLTTNLMEAPVKLQLLGSVGEVTLVGPGWSSESGVLEIGTLDGRSATLRRLIVLVRGENAKQMKFKVARVEPDFLKVTVGDTKVDDTGLLSQTQVLIEIPASKVLGKKAPADYMGNNQGKLGEILLETTGPQTHSLPIRVRFAVSGGT